MRADGGGAIEKQRGSASLELVGVLPFLLLAVAVAAQLVLAGGSLWSAAIAARAGARAQLVGRSPVSSAKAALPPPLRGGARVESGDGVSVKVPVPGVVPALPGFRVAAGAALGASG
jgi:hypothetical protein